MMADKLWDGVREGCGTCEFGSAGAKQQWTDAVGIVHKYLPVTCRRYPPTLLQIEQRNPYGGPSVMQQLEQHQPTMDVADWCGEYIRRGTRDTTSR